MKKVILDTSALIKRPEVLSLSSPETQVIITDPVFDELTRYPVAGSGSSFLPALEKALDVGNVIPSDITKDRLWSALPIDMPVSGTISESDRQLLSYTAVYKNENPNDEIFIATEDKNIATNSSKLGINVINSKELQSLLEKSGKKDETIRKQVQRSSKSQRWGLLLNLFFSFLSGLLANYIYPHITKIIQTINVWATILSILILAFVFFWIRSRFRLFYGITEFVVGAIVCLRLFWPNFDYSTFNPVVVLQLLGGFYIMVRGLDNFSKGIRGTRLNSYWKRWFPE